MKVRADRRVGLLLAGVLLLTLVSIGATVVLPASDPSLDAKATELDASQSAGEELYREKGLWYCNAAYVRETSVDRAITTSGATTPAEIDGQSPAMLGLERTVTDPTDAQAVADACGVKLSEEQVTAVQAFLDTRPAE